MCGICELCGRTGSDADPALHVGISAMLCKPSHGGLGEQNAVPASSNFFQKSWKLLRRNGLRDVGKTVGNVDNSLIYAGDTQIIPLFIGIKLEVSGDFRGHNLVSSRIAEKFKKNLCAKKRLDVPYAFIGETAPDLRLQDVIFSTTEAA